MQLLNSICKNYATHYGGEKMYIILGKFLSQKFLNTFQFKAKII